MSDSKDIIDQINFAGIYVQVDGHERSSAVKRKLAKQKYFTENISQPDVAPGRLELCLIGWRRGYVNALGLSIKRGISVSSGRTLRIEGVVPIAEVAFADLLPGGETNQVYLAAAAQDSVRIDYLNFREVLRAILYRSPDRADDIIRLINLVLNRTSSVTGNRAAVLAEQRDALGVAIEMLFGEPARRVLLNSSSVIKSETAESYIDTLDEEYLREDLIITGDFIDVPGWEFDTTIKKHKRRFKIGRRSLDVIMANRTLIEEATGVDLLYHDVNADTYVFIQYKRLVRDSRLSPFRYWPSSDTSYQEELEKMRAADAYLRNLGSSGGLQSYRSSGSPFFFKFCKSLVLEARMSQLSDGFYVPLDLWELFVSAGPRGPKGGLSVSESSMTKRMSNEVFMGLFNRGMLGSQPEAGPTMKNVVDRALKNDRSVVVVFARTAPTATEIKRARDLV